LKQPQPTEETVTHQVTDKSPLSRFLALAVALLVVAGAMNSLTRQTARADSGITVYVSTTGDDSNSGLDLGDPVQSLPRAQQIVRGLNGDMTENITVQLAGGTYRLSSPLTLTSADSGSNDYSVDWTSAPGETAIISGAEQISNWHDGAHGIWSATVPSGLQTRQIYVNGARAYLASGLPPVALKRTATGYTASSTVMATWKNPTEIEFVYPVSLGYMVEPVCPVAAISGKVIIMAEPCWNNSNNRGSNNIVGYPGSQLGNPAYIQNALPLLTQPGQFYLDESGTTLYYMPRSGQDMQTADVEVPTLQTLIQGSGTLSQPITNISFANLQFSYATWMQPETPNGFSEVQEGYSLTGQDAYATEGLCNTVANGTCPFGNWNKEPGNIQFSFDQDISFSGDQFVHLGAAALNLDDGSQGDTVVGCIFTDISGNGIELGGVDRPQAAGASATINDVISNNALYGFPVEFHGGVPIAAGYVSGTTISHNDIHDIPWAAVSVGWGGWLDKIGQSPVANNDHDNIVSDNLIQDFMESLKDGGGVYTQGIQGPNLADGLTVSGNVIDNQLDWGGALKADNGTANVTYSGNVLYNNYYDWDYDVNTSSNATIMSLLNNYWQQGDFPPSKYPNVSASGNSVITGAADAPTGVVTNAGLESGYSALADYVLEGSAAPAAPELVSALYAYKTKAYITWHPSYDAGSSPVTSYSIQACKASSSGQCAGTALHKVTVPASQLATLGYAVYSGLSSGKTYAFTVVGTNAAGSSIASVPAIVTPVSSAPKTLSAPTSLTARPSSGGYVTLIWNHPSSTKGVQNLSLRTHRGANHYATAGPDANKFVLSYSIVGSNGKKYVFTSHVLLVETNTNGRVLYVVGGLTPGKVYKFSVSAANPAGTGKAASVSFTAK
jgi:hypothetical protein